MMPAESGEIFAGDMARRAGAGRTEIDLAGIGLGVRNQFSDGFRRERGIHHQRVRRIADQADRREILARIVADALVERGPDRERAGVTQHQRVAVGLALGDRAGADSAAGAGAVVDHDLFTEQLTHLVGDAAADDRGRAARRKGNDERDRARRIVLRAGAVETCGESDRDSDCDPFGCNLHLEPPYFHANTGCSSSATRVFRPASTSRN